MQNYTKAKVMGYDGLIMAPDLEYPSSDEKFFSSIDRFDNLTTGVAFSYDEFENNIDKDYYNKLLLSKSDVKIIDKRTKNKEQSDFKSFTALLPVYYIILSNKGVFCQKNEKKSIFFPKFSFLVSSNRQN